MDFIVNNYKLLPALVSILQTRNLTDSARELNVTQSAMSKTLGLIRESFHDPILIRQGNRFLLTQRAQVLKDQLPTLISQLDDLYLPMDVSPRQCKRKFNFAFSSFVAKSVLPMICSGIEKAAPLVSIESSLWQTEKLTDLGDTDVDLVATIADEIPENLYGKLMAEDQYVLLFNKNHALVNKKITLESYLSAKHILVSGVVDKSRQADDALKLSGNQRYIFATVPSFHAAFDILINTQTIITAPLHIANKYVQKFDLAIRPLPKQLPPHQYYLLWHAKHQQDPEHKWFRELCFPILQSYLQQQITQGLTQLALIDDY